MIEKGAMIICRDEIEGYITNGKFYMFEGIDSYAGRAIITDDRGKEGHFATKRFEVSVNGEFIGLDKAISDSK